GGPVEAGGGQGQRGPPVSLRLERGRDLVPAPRAVPRAVDEDEVGGGPRPAPRFAGAGGPLAELGACDGRGGGETEESTAGEGAPRHAGHVRSKQIAGTTARFSESSPKGGYQTFPHAPRSPKETKFGSTPSGRRRNAGHEAPMTCWSKNANVRAQASSASAGAYPRCIGKNTIRPTG